MRRIHWLAVAPVLVLGFIACVGDDPQSGGINPENEGGSPNGDGSVTDSPSSDGISPLGDGGDGSTDGPATPPCGYPGEACCIAPLKPCNDGASCSTGATKKCLVNTAWAVGEYTVLAGGTFTDRTVTAQYDGSTWTRGPDVPTDWRPQAIYQASASSIRIVSFHNNDQGGKVFGLVGGTWKECTPGNSCVSPLLSGGKLPDFYAVTSVDNEFWLGGVNQIYRCASGATSCASTTTGLTGTWAFGNFAGTTASDLWYSAIDRAFHYDGTKWTIHPNLKAYSIYQVRKNDTWVGTTTLQHWNGTAWSSEYNVDGNPAPGSIFSIGGSATDDVWAVGNTFSAHWNGAAWSLVAFPAAATNVQSLWAPSKTEAFVVGDNAGIFKWDGATWSQVTSPQIAAGVGETILSPLRWVAVHGLARPRP